MAFIVASWGTKKGTIAIYDTISETKVFKKLELVTFTFGVGSGVYLSFVSSSTSLFELFNDESSGFSLYEIDLNFNTGD